MEPPKCYQKRRKKYHCIFCDYDTFEKSKWERHILTAKHKRNIKGRKKDGSEIKCEFCGTNLNHQSSLSRHRKTCKMNPSVIALKLPFSCPKLDTNKGYQKRREFKYECECGKLYKTRSGLSKHMKKCYFVDEKEEDTSSDTLNKVLESQVKLTDTQSQFYSQQTEFLKKQTEIMKENQELRKELMTLKMGDTYNTTNNLNQTNNNITLNVFLNEHCKDALNLEDFMKNVSFKLKDVLNDGNYVENCVSIKLLNDLNDIPPLKRPIHCTDKRRKNFVIKDKQEGWVQDKGNSTSKIKEEIDRLYDKAYIDFYHAYDDENPLPHNSRQMDEKMHVSNKIMKKKEKASLVTMLAKEVDVKEAMKELKDKKQ